MIEARNAPPNDRRNFVHKRIGRAVSGFVTGGPTGAARGFISGGSDNAAKEGSKQAGRLAKLGVQPSGGLSLGLGRSLTRFARRAPLAITRPTTAPAGLTVPRLPVAGCIPPFFDDGMGGCELDLIPGPGGGGRGPMRDIGEAVMGRYGAGEIPGNLVVNRAVCRPGMVVGDDGICYNRSQIRNSQRQWPRGRRPLLTGGDMRAISTAARAGKRLEGASKRLQKIGLMKKPAPRRKMITSGPTDHHHHS